MAQRILVVEDEADLLQAVCYSLEKEGYEPVAAPDGKTALEKARELPPPDLVILDLMLPDMGGLDICRSIRNDEKLADVPIIMATARGDEIDRVVGFEMGADDYVVKPFSVRELLLRVKAILRRKQEPTKSKLGKFGVLTIDMDAKQVFVGEDEVALTSLEFRLLETLFLRKGRVQTRETLLSDVWEVRPDLTTRTVDTTVKRLREKLGEAGGYVETVRGFGYRFAQKAPEARG